jgi:hypothetical protein
MDGLRAVMSQNGRAVPVYLLTYCLKYFSNYMTLRFFMVRRLGEFIANEIHEAIACISDL